METKAQNQSHNNRLLRLFVSSLYISAFTFGGGYVIVSLMKKKYVDELHWLDEDVMLDLTAIAQSAPGAVAVNAALLTGYRLAGVAGAAVSVVGTIIPPFVILSILSVGYAAFCSNPVVAAVLRGMQSGVAAVIADVVVNLGQNVAKNGGAVSLGIAVCVFAASWWGHVNVMVLLAACAALALVRMLLEKRRTAQKGGQRA